jgi:hypothetical protein
VEEIMVRAVWNGAVLVYKKDTHQVTIDATITPATPQALAAIINGNEPPTNTSILDPSPRHNRRSWRDHHDNQRQGARWGGERGATGWDSAARREAERARITLLLVKGRAMT